MKTEKLSKLFTHPYKTISHMSEGSFLFMPRDILSHLLLFLSSQDRSAVCPVSRLFNEYAVSVSKSLSLVPQFYDGTKDELTKSTIENIFTSGDYHLIVRLKNTELIDLQIACKSGNQSIIKLFIDLLEGLYKAGVNYWNDGLYGACKGGHLPVIELMIQKGANEWNWGLVCACEGGHLPIVQLMIEKGANQWNNGLHGACKGGHVPAIELIIEKGKDQYVIDWNQGLIGACIGGHLSIVELIIERAGPSYIFYWNWGLSSACKSGHFHVIGSMIEKGATKCSCGKSIEQHIHLIASSNTGIR